MEHVVRRACDTSIVSPTLPDQLQEVVHTGKNIVHEDDTVKVLVLGVSELVQWHERSISHLCEVLDTMVERSSGTHRRLDFDPQPN